MRGAPQVGLAWHIWRMSASTARGILGRPGLRGRLFHREPTPASMPPEDRVGLDDDERSAPSRPQVTKPRPEQPIDWPQPQAPTRPSLQDRQLMPQCDVLDLERRLALQARTQRCEKYETDPTWP